MEFKNGYYLNFRITVPISRLIKWHKVIVILTLLIAVPTILITPPAYSQLTFTSPQEGQTPGASPTGSLRIRVDKIEVTQAIQDIETSVPLIAGKRTLVRVYLSGGPIELLSAELAAEKEGAASELLHSEKGIVPVEPSLSTGRKRRELGRSLNFLLPDDLDLQGSWTFRLRSVKDRNGRSVECDNCSTSTKPVTFGKPVELRLLVIGFRYKAVPASRNTAPGAQRETFKPREDDYRLLYSWLKRAYPISKLTVQRRLQDVSPTITEARGFFSCTDLNSQIVQIRAADVAKGLNDYRKRYYGFVYYSQEWQQSAGEKQEEVDVQLPATSPSNERETIKVPVAADGSFFMRGCANIIPQSPDPGVPASGPTGRTDYNNLYPWDTDGSWGDWYGGHELGHTFGRYHAGPPKKDAGGSDIIVDGHKIGPCDEAYPDEAFPYPEGKLGQNGRFVGLDLGDDFSADKAAQERRANQTQNISAIPPSLQLDSRSHDIMSYCENQWISAYTYKGILERLRAENDLRPPLPGQGLGAEAGNGPLRSAGVEEQSKSSLNAEIKEGDFITIVGTASLSQHTASINFVRRVPRAELRPVDPRSPVRLRLINRDDQDIVPAPFLPVSFLPNSDPQGKDDSGVIRTVIAAPANLKRVELLIDNQVAARFEADPNIRLERMHPELAFENLTVGAQLDGADHQKISSLLKLDWSRRLEVQKSMQYDVEVSRDNGKTWETVAIGLSTPQTDIDVSDYLDDPQIEVRVIANAGFEKPQVIAQRQILTTRANP